MPQNKFFLDYYLPKLQLQSKESKRIELIFILYRLNQFNSGDCSNKAILPLASFSESTLKRLLKDLSEEGKWFEYLCEPSRKGKLLKDKDLKEKYLKLCHRNQSDLYIATIINKDKKE